MRCLSSRRTSSRFACAHVDVDGELPVLVLVYVSQTIAVALLLVVVGYVAARLARAVAQRSHTPSVRGG